MVCYSAHCEQSLKGLRSLCIEEFENQYLQIEILIITMFILTIYISILKRKMRNAINSIFQISIMHAWEWSWNTIRGIEKPVYLQIKILIIPMFLLTIIQFHIKRKMRNAINSIFLLYGDAHCDT